MRTLRIERFELQKLRDSWLRGNFNYTHEFIDWINKRMKFYEEETKDNQTYARNGDDKMAEICDICSSESDIEMIATLGMDLCCDCRRKVFKELEEEVKIMRKLRKK